MTRSTHQVYRRRRNPDDRLDAEDIIAVAESMGLRNLAAMLRNAPAAQVQATVDAINEAIEEEDEAPPAALTDRQAWKRLEGLAGSVGEKKGWPGELINALKAVFAKRAAEAS
jgi:hypothetical protein